MGTATFSGTIAAQNHTAIRTNGPLSIAGELLVDAGVTVEKRGAGVATLSGGHRLSSGSTVNIHEGTLRFLTGLEDRVRISDSAVATVDLAATLELAGTKAALSNGSDHVNLSNGGTLNVTGPNQAVGAIDGDGAVFVTGVGELTATYLRQRFLLSISGPNAKAAIRPNGSEESTSVLGGMEISLGGRLDLNDNDLIMPASAVTKNAIHNAMKGRITSAQNGVDANFITKWDGSGVTSSTARTANVATGFDLTGLGLIRNSDLEITTGVPGSTYTTFSGQPVTPHDVLIKYTYIGDANLSGL